MTTHRNPLSSVARAAVFAGAVAIAAAASPAAAQVALSGTWTRIAGGTTGSPISGTFAKGTGTNRVLVVFVAADYSVAATAFAPTGTYGGQTITRWTSSDTSSRQKTWMGWLDDAGITAATGAPPTLSITLPTTNLAASVVYAAFYTGVNQTAPLATPTGSNSTSSDTSATTVTFGATINYAANGMVIYGTNVNGTAANTATPPAGYTERFDGPLESTTFQPSVADIARAAAGSSNDTVTFLTANRSALSVVSLAPAASNTLTVGNGTEPANSTISQAQTASLDAFTLQTNTGTATVSQVVVNMASVTNVASIFLHSTATCTGGTTYGTLSAGLVAGNNTIATTGLSATTTASNAWVCITSAATVTASSTITGNVSNATATGYTVTDNDTASATVTINPPPAITVGNGTEPANSTISQAQTASLDAFTLQTSSGTATVTQVVVNMASVTNVASIFLHSTATCTGGTTYGTLSAGLVAGNNTITTTGLSATTTASNAWVCITSAATVSASSAITGNVSSATATGYTATDNDTASATVTINPPAAVALTIGNGTEPANSTISQAQTASLDAFTLQAASGTATVTQVVVNMASVTNVASIFLHSTATCSGGTTYGTLSAGLVAGNNTIATTGLSATTTASNAWVCLTSAATVSASSTITGNVSSATATGYTATDNDTASATVTINPPAAVALTIGNGSAEPPSGNLNQAAVAALDAFTLQTASGTATVTQVVVSVTNGTALAGLAINSASNCGGTSYGSIGAVVTGNNNIATSGLSATTTSGATTLYVCATGGTVAAATPVTGTLLSATAAGFTSTDNDTASATLTVQVPAGGTTLTVGNGSDPANIAIAPADAATVPTALDAFTLQTSTGSDPVSSIVVQFNSGSWAGIDVVSIQNTAACNMPTPLGSRTAPPDTATITVTGITATTTSSNYWVCIKPKLHADLIPPPGNEFAVTGTVIGLVSGYTKVFLDTASAIVTIDNKSPANPVFGTVTPGNGQVNLAWTNPPDTDFNQVVLIRKIDGPVNVTPVEGTTYTGNTTFPTDATNAIRYVGPASPFNDTTVTNNHPTYYAIFAKDGHGNYSVGARFGPVYPGSNPLPVGDPTTNSTKPVVAILNPAQGGVVAGTFRLQVRVFSPTVAIGTVQVTSNPGAATPTWTTLTRVSAYGAAGGIPDKGVFEVTGGLTLPAGSYTLVARATNTAGTTNSGPVAITVNAATVSGDGRLLVRDNSSQLCIDCHALATHSSESTGSTYGSWSVACRDCHTPHGTTNIYLVPTQITPPPLNSTVYTPRSVYFYTKNGSPGAGGGASSSSYVNTDNSGPCQVCHTRTLYYRNDATVVSTHNAGQVCSSCHAHQRGLAAVCTDCHGTAGRTGVVSNVSAAPPVAYGGATTGVRVGAHLPHVTQNRYRSAPLECSECHPMPNTHQQPPESSIDAAWSSLGTGNGAVVPTPAAGTGAQGFGYTPTWDSTPTCTNWCHGAGLSNAGASVPSPNWTAGSSQAACGACHASPPPINASEPHPQNTVCSDCHGSGYLQGTVSGGALTTHIDGSINKPANGCTACHGVLAGVGGAAVANTSPTAAPGYSATAEDTHGNTLRSAVGVGAHVKHVNGGIASAFGCAVCHGALPANGTTTHANGTILASWSAPATSGGVTPTPAASFNSWVSPYTCTNYCHSNATPLGGTNSPGAAANWTSTTAMTCTNCHGDGTAGLAVSAKHTKHLASGTYNMDCATCHSATGTRTSITNPANHVNGTKTLAFGSIGTVNQTQAVYTSTSTTPNYTCNTSYCHSNGTVATYPFAAPARTTLNWSTGLANADCADCHGGNATAGVVLASGSHTAHINQTAYIGTNLGCVNCHGATVSADRTLAPGAYPLGTGTHVNGQKNVSASGWVSPSCSTTNYCHSSGQASPQYYSATWGTPLANDCLQCHGRYTPASFTSLAGEPNYANGGTAAATANSHGAHVPRTSVANAAASCTNCHFNLVAPAGLAIVGSSHTNGTRDVAFSGTGSYNGAVNVKQCSNVSCHGSGQPQWGATLSCASCHGTAGRTKGAGIVNVDPNFIGAPPTGLGGETAVTTRAVGAHQAHINQATYRNDAIMCSECHSGVSHNGTKEVAAGTLAMSNIGSPLPAPLSATLGWTGTTCSSTYCHGDFKNGSNATMTWAQDITLSCTSCHGMPPTGHAAGDTNCGGCHPGYGSVASPSVNKATHINGALDGGESGGNTHCWNCHKTDTTVGTQYQAMQSNTTLYHHVMATDVALSGTTITVYPTVATGQSACVQCHADHNVFKDALNTANSYGRGANLRTRIGTAPPASATTITAAPGDAAPGYYDRTDYLTTGVNGICASCHTASLTKSTTAQKSDASTATAPIDAVGFSTSAHQYVVAGRITNGSSTFNANCMKCHSDPPASGASGSYPQYQNGTYKFVLHTNPDRRLRNPLGITTPIDNYNGNFCVRCHSKSTDTGTPGGGPLKSVANADYFNAVGMTVRSQGIWAAVQKANRHNATNTTRIHSPMEGQPSATSTAHVTCEDCHDVHATKALPLKPANNNNTVWGPLTGASGATPAFVATNWTAPTYTATASATKEYEICFKCHSGYNLNLTGWGGTGTWAGSANQANWTDIGREFNPANKGRHPVAAASNAAGSGTTSLATTQLVSGWTPGMIMTCSDCHGADVNLPESQGPHGSAVRFMLKGSWRNWPYTTVGGTTLIAFSNVAATGAFCMNCHPRPSDATNSNGFHKLVGTLSDHNANYSSCMGCHIRVPHGGKVSRLIVTTNAPARYKGYGATPPVTFRKFVKGANKDNYSWNQELNCTGSHGSITTTGEAW